LKKRQKECEHEEEDVSCYLMTLMKRKYARLLKMKNKCALSGGLALEDAMNLPQNGLRNK
jgi:hypothetical protein